MIITDIQPRKKSLFAVYIDGEPIELDKETVLFEILHEGDNITWERLEELKDKSSRKRAKEKALWLLSKRDYSKSELKKKIMAEAPEEIAEEVVLRMEELNLINDEKYAQKYASDLINFKSLSPKMVKVELIHKGIDKEIANEVIENIPFNAAESIETLIERKYKRSLVDEKGIRRTFAALTRKGYAYDEIRSAIRAYTEKEGFDDDL